MLGLRSLLLLMGVFALAQFATAQDPQVDLRRDRTPRVARAIEPTTGPLTQTPEMWFYEQERSRYDDPKMAIRRRAEARAQQRQDRLASMEWYGMSNSRPIVAATPWCSNYSPLWTSNSYDPMRWRPLGRPLVVRPEVGE